MVDITQPTILGYAITPWLIVLCSCIIGAVIFAVLIVLGFSKRESKECEMIENAVKNTANIPVKNIEIPTMDFGMEGQEATESMIDDNTEEAISYETEVMDFETEVLDDRTEVSDLGSETEVLAENGENKPNFCSKCGNRVKGNFCSHCGYKIK